MTSDTTTPTDTTDAPADRVAAPPPAAGSPPAEADAPETSVAPTDDAGERREEASPRAEADDAPSRSASPRTAPTTATTASTTAAEPSPETIARLRLSGIAGITPRLAARLVRRFGSAAAALSAGERGWREVRGVGSARAALLRTAPSRDDVMAEIRRAAAADAAVLVPGDPAWPPGLDDLDDPPLALFARGTLRDADLRGVAIVGSRRCSAYGRAQARRLASGLARLGITIVSGLARGVDGAAHRGALESGGRTVGVLGGGLARFYPPEHVPLAREIASGHGAVLSEFPLDVPPLPHHFPRRNRILAAMSAAVVVVEAGERSGSLHTADHALDLGRDVLAVPGRVDCPTAKGTHRLLREGAAVCEGVEDVLHTLGIEVETDADGGVPPSATDDERALLEALTGRELSADDALDASGLDLDAGLAALAALELRGLLTLGDDGLYARV